jgi:AcrR family transcriptional regulator
MCSRLPAMDVFGPLRGRASLSLHTGGYRLNECLFIDYQMDKMTPRKLDETTKKKHQAHWHRRPEARRPEILEAALTVFAEKGFYGARIDEIAKRASLTPGTLYIYFKSKEEIFKTLVQESIGARVSELTEVVRNFEGSSADLIRFILRGINNFLLSSNRAVLPKLIIAETGNFPELGRFYKDEVTDRMLATFEEIVRRGIMRGEFRELNLKHASRLVFQPAMFTAIWRTSLGALDSEPYDYEGFMQTHLDILLRGFAPDAKA